MRNKTKTLVKLDKNGTKYYHCVETCPDCKGTGNIPYYKHVQDGVCFLCGGSGVHEFEEKEYAPEYEEMLEKRGKVKREKAEAKMKKQAEISNQKFFAKHGFDENGNTFVVLGETFSIKEKLKKDGAKWSNCIGWHFAVKPLQYPTVLINVDDVYEKDCWLCYVYLPKRQGEETYSRKIKEAIGNMV